MAEPVLLRFFRPRPNERILLLEGEGELAQSVAALTPAGELLLLARDLRQITHAEALLTGLPHVCVSAAVLPKATGDWDTVLLTLPKGRRYARTLLLAAWLALRPGGQLWLIGDSQTGVNAAITDAQRLFGNGVVVGYKQHQRVARSVRGDTLPDPLPPEFAEAGIAPGTSYFMEVTRPQSVLTLETHPGIFSWDALDEGTGLLLEHLRVQPGERVWDVGCGAGVIGLSAALAGASRVRMSDVNLLAVEYARRNSQHNGLADRVEVLAADGLAPPDGQWNLIVANPAFHTGHKVDTSMVDALIAAAPARLAPGGRLLLVANRFLAYEKALSRFFSTVARVADTPQYHVLDAR